MPKRKVIFIQDAKLRGEWVESVFMARAGELGIEVSRPWGDSKSYDFVIGRPGNFASVQVKSTVCRSGGGYECGITGPQNQAYPPGSFDFIAAYVVLEDAWYILPAKKVQGRETVCLFSKSKYARYEDYREAWQLLREAAHLVEQAETGDGAEQLDEESETSAEQADAPATPSGPFPRNALERMEAVANFVRRQLAGGAVRAATKCGNVPNDNARTGNARNNNAK